MVHITNVKINTDKITRPKKILTASDLHLTKDLGFEHLKEIKDEINMEDIHHIIMPGDLVNDVNELKKTKFRNKVLQALSDFAEDKQVFISTGNHDQMTKANKGWKRGDYSLFEETIKELPNFHLIRNGKRITSDGITYSAFSPDFSYYEDENKNRKDLESPDDYNKAFFESYRPNPFARATFNVLLTHEPQSIIKLSLEKGKCIQGYADLVVSGHMHDGMVPFSKRVYGNRGIISPQMQLFPEYARGTVNVGDTTFVINGPVNAMVENSLANKLMGANATVIELEKTKRR